MELPYKGELNFFLILLPFVRAISEFYLLQGNNLEGRNWFFWKASRTYLNEAFNIFSLYFHYSMHSHLCFAPEFFLI